MMPDPEVIQIIIQGGAVGILLAFGVGVYMLARRGMGMVNEFVSNHMAHLTGAVERVEQAMTRLDASIDRLSKNE